MSTKCIIILSEKSSGSSILQTVITRLVNAHHISSTPHSEYETLYWTNAASILGKHQTKMIDSVVPLPAPIAREELVSLLAKNLPDFNPPCNDRELIMTGWKALCERFAPVFIEKSPHHLCQWSALELIIDCIQELRDIDFLLIGLVRNPMDTLYSQYRRWKSRPEETEKQWCRAYHNMIMLRDMIYPRKRLMILRYEDLVTSLKSLSPVFRFCDQTPERDARIHLYRHSLHRWENDYLYSFNLSRETSELAQEYGYTIEELTNEQKRFSVGWPLIREYHRAIHRTERALRRAGKSILRPFLG